MKSRPDYSTTDFYKEARKIGYSPEQAIRYTEIHFKKEIGERDKKRPHCNKGLDSVLSILKTPKIERRF